MRSIGWVTAAALAAGVAGAGQAQAAESLESRVAAVEARLASGAAPSSREVQSAVDAYLASSTADASLVGGPGAAGYDGGFWIRGGSFLLRTNLTLQARYEAFLWDDKDDEPSPGGDLSGFSLPRATLKFSGEATCNVGYYLELEFGHPGMAHMPEEMMIGDLMVADFGTCREAWIEYAWRPELAVRMGLVKTAATRQLMTPPEFQQFVDISLASASVGMMMPGYTDRNRDYGIMLHGAFGCDGDLSYLFTVTNGDGPVHRNVLDGETNDNLAYSGRLNWDVIGHLGYDECAITRGACEWELSVGVWGYGYTDVVFDQPHTGAGDVYDLGADVAGGYGGFSFCAAYTWSEQKGGDAGWDPDLEANCWCVQVGYLFPGTAWEVAARYSYLDMDMMGMTMKAEEFGVAVNYFIDGHADKVTLDATWISGDEAGNETADTYAGYNVTGTGDALMLRLQWQLAL
jgi:hypothetical protein